MMVYVDDSFRLQLIEEIRQNRKVRYHERHCNLLVIKKMEIINGTIGRDKNFNPTLFWIHGRDF